MENFLTIETRSGPMNVFISADSSLKEKPVILVFQEAFGVNHHIRSVCTRFAQEGYIAIAPEFFHREGQHVVVDYGNRNEMRSLMGRLSNKSLLEDIKDVLSFLPELPYVDLSRVYTIGFCMGGFTSLLAATEFSLSGAISFYGAGVTHKREGIGLSPFLQDFPKMTCPVLLFYGEQDASIPFRERETIKNALSEAEIDLQLIVYPHADHGFFCNERKVYHQAAAGDAWKKSLNWLAHMGGVQKRNAPDKGAFYDSQISG